MTGIAGSMIAILDAFLVNGFNSKSATASGDGTYLTISVGASHGFIENQVIELSGAAQSELNSQFRVFSVGTTFVKVLNSFTGVASGSIFVKSPSAGWEKSFSGTNIAVYRSTDPTGTRLYLRVDDTAGKYGLVRGYEQMADVNTGSGLFPTTSQAASGVFWMKSVTADSTARVFKLIADSRMLYLFIDFNIAIASHKGYEFMVFGDINSYKVNDAYGCVIAGANQVENYQHQYSSSVTSQGGGSIPRYIARSYTQIGSCVTHSCYGNKITDFPGYLPSSGSTVVLPSPIDNGIILDSGWFIYELVASVIRGKWAGAYFPIQFSATFPDAFFFKGDGLLQDRLFILLALGLDLSSNYGRVAIDLTGPWR